jgi:Protein of unknown function (DUF3011)
VAAFLQLAAPMTVRFLWVPLITVLFLAGTTVGQAQTTEPTPPPTNSADPAPTIAQPPAPVTCTSIAGERKHCDANTSAGVVLARSFGLAECLLGKTWGYDDTGIWVSEGCSGEFVTAASALVSTAPVDAQPAPRKPTDRIETWGEFDPGDGFLVGRSSAGELSISAYGLVRYINQMPGSQTFTDHLGNERTVDGRNDIHPHRIIIFLKGWVGTPKLIYTLFFWTVNTTDQDAIFAVLGYQFDRKFSLYAGINGTPGTRSLQGSHPFWLGHDRVMADEFFRPYFAYGTWAQGEITKGLWYNVFVGNNSSSLGIKATQLDRELSTGASFWWMPTTKEFGPKGAYGDWEWHDKVATRFGISSSFSPEERFTDSTTGATGNTVLKLADSLNVFDTGSLAPGVTVQKVDYRLIAVDAGVKYKGIFVQTEAYFRNLHGFVADGPLPVREIIDRGFYVQAAFFPVKKKLEVYGATSQIFGDKDAGFSNSHEYLGGLNYYPVDTRNHRLNLQVMDVDHSPVSSTFGYYVGGQNGTTVSLAFSVFF